jgi:hypothetical protein
MTLAPNFHSDASNLNPTNPTRKSRFSILAEGSIGFKLGGNEIPFTNQNFLLSFSLSNSYFHVTTTYDILRKLGTPLGKRDFLGPMKMGT